MKRLLSLTLAAALLAALTLPAAAESQDARLAKVTQLVKSALALDTDSYETFHGGVSEDLVPVWSLSWEGDQRSLSVEALEDGTVVNLYRWENDVRPGDYRWAFPTFPESGGEGDRGIAGEFLRRVLRPGETAELETPQGAASLGGSDRSWNGFLRLNGLPSPLHYSISVENGQVRHFSRDVPEAAFLGGVPSPDAQADQAQAKDALSETLRLRLEYVLEASTAARAVLRYTPENTHEFQVDAKTGELLDVTELEEKLSKDYEAAAGSNGAAPTAMDAAADRGEGGLTEVELEGVAELEGVLAKEALDTALRAESAYGLRGYALVSAAYEADREGGVSCSLRYVRTENGGRRTRNITVDAKTGAVESVWSSASPDQEKALSEEEALKKAESFLKAWHPDWNLTLYQAGSDIMPLRTDSQPYWSFTFAQAVHGLPFRENAVRVGIDGADGSIYSLSFSWDGGVTFDDANGLVSMETALAVWAGSYEAALAYRGVPQKLVRSDPAQAKLLERGVEYAYALRLTYGLERETSYAGVDAKSGQLVPEDRGHVREPLAYQDLAGSAAKADIEKLAKYGAGWAVDSFRPGKSLTQWELVCLVYSLDGTALDPDAAGADGREAPYYYAYRLGLLTPAERDDGAVLTQSQLVKMLLNAAGYGPAARLQGVYTCDYEDNETISAEELGYAAIAQALGMASGSYRGSRSATRGEAASMLCRVLERAV